MTFSITIIIIIIITRTGTDFNGTRKMYKFTMLLDFAATLFRSRRFVTRRRANSIWKKKCRRAAAPNAMGRCSLKEKLKKPSEQKREREKCFLRLRFIRREQCPAATHARRKMFSQKINYGCFKWFFHKVYPGSALMCAVERRCVDKEKNIVDPSQRSYSWGSKVGQTKNTPSGNRSLAAFVWIWRFWVSKMSSRKFVYTTTRFGANQDDADPVHRSLHTHGRFSTSKFRLNTKTLAANGIHFADHIITFFFSVHCFIV